MHACNGTMRAFQQGPYDLQTPFSCMPLLPCSAHRGLVDLLGMALVGYRSRCLEWACRALVLLLMVLVRTCVLDATHVWDSLSRSSAASR